MDDETNRNPSAPARLRSIAAELASLLGCHVPRGDERRAGSSLWAPFGFIPLLVDEQGVRGLHAHHGSGWERPDELPVAWWDAARGQLAPLSGNLGRYLELVRQGIRFDRFLGEPRARQALEIDPDSAPAAAAMAGSLLDRGRAEEAEGWMRRAAQAAPWWMAPCLLLSNLARLRGRRAEAATWCATALTRRWDSTGGGRSGPLPRLGAEPRRILRGAVGFLRRHEAQVPGLAFDGAWRCLRDAADALDVRAHSAAARELARTGRLGEAAARWEWLALAQGMEEAAGRAERAYATLAWPLHRRHSRLLRLAVGR